MSYSLSYSQFFTSFIGTVIRKLLVVLAHSGMFNKKPSSPVSLSHTNFFGCPVKPRTTRLTASSLMAVQSNLRNWGCSESSLSIFHLCHFCRHLLSLFFYFISAASCYGQQRPQVHIFSEAMSSALNCCFCLPADQCSCCNLAMQDPTRQRVLRAS